MAKQIKKNKKKQGAVSKFKRFSLSLIYFLFRHKISCLLIIVGVISFAIIRKEEILRALKDTTIRIIYIKSDAVSGFEGEEAAYLNKLKEKYGGYGRQIYLAEAKKAVEDGCNYIANIEGYSFWNTLNAKDLLLATAFVESDLRARYSQYGGNAVGIFQIEYITFKDLWQRSLPKSYPKLYKAMRQDFGEIDFEMLQNNDTIAAIFARLVYARAKTSIPYRNDINAQAAYYKKYYNTHLGKAKTDTFIKKKNSMHKVK